MASLASWILPVEAQLSPLRLNQVLGEGQVQEAKAARRHVWRGRHGRFLVWDWLPAIATLLATWPCLTPSGAFSSLSLSGCHHEHFCSFCPHVSLLNPQNLLSQGKVPHRCLEQSCLDLCPSSRLGSAVPPGRAHGLSCTLVSRTVSELSRGSINTSEYRAGDTGLLLLQVPGPGLLFPVPCACSGSLL